MKTKLLFGLILGGIFLLQCGKDNPTEPTPSAKIQGTVTFSGSWPESAEEVRVVAGKDFPVKSWDDLEKSDKLAAEGSVNYTINVEGGDYKFVGVAWKAAGGVWGLASICGVYTTDSGFQTPAMVSLGSNSATAADIDISVNRSQARKLTGAQVVGSVTLQGAWPDSFASAMVITSAKDLIADSYTLLDLNMGTAVERGQTTVDYKVDTPAGTNRTIGVVFLDAEGRLTQEAVYFSQNNGGLQVSEMNISGSSFINGPNLTVRLGSITSAIQGTISFLGNWPAPTAEIRLITTTVFPPAIDELIIGEEISATTNSHKYTFYLNPGIYKLMGVAWRAEGTNWDIMSVCGAYFAGTDSLAPSEVVIPDDQSIVKDINIVVNRSKARKVTETYIQGAVTFAGTWPANFTEARVIATTKFQIFPTILPTMLDFALSDPIAPGATSFNYKIKAWAGRFAAVGVVFLKGDEKLVVNDILYSLDRGGLSIEAFDVAENATVAGPDFAIQF